ncbi:MAG: hypothetical protein ACRCSE_07470 [Vibrio sp.]
MQSMSPLQIEAFRLIKEAATISGTAAKLAELEKQAPANEQEDWGYVWEAFHAATDERGIMEMLELPE